MAGLKEIRRRLKSVANTRKITYAMKLVSAAKLRKTQDAAAQSRKYTELLNGVLADLLSEQDQNSDEIAHPLLQVRETQKKIALIVLGGARGLCGAYNAQLNRRVDTFFKEKPGVEISSYLFSRKPAEYFRRIGRPYTEAFETILEQPETWPTDDLSQRLEAAFTHGDIDEVYIAYTRFKSAVSMSPVVEKILPLDPSTLQLHTQTVSNHNHAHAGKESGLTIFEPSKPDVLATILPRIVRARIRQAALDAKASEHASRMTAMDAATKNAKDLINNLTLERNRVRQSGITSQLLDIVGGAEALS